MKRDLYVTFSSDSTPPLSDEIAGALQCAEIVAVEQTYVSTCSGGLAGPERSVDADLIDAFLELAQKMHLEVGDVLRSMRDLLRDSTYGQRPRIDLGTNKNDAQYEVLAIKKDPGRTKFIAKNSRTCSQAYLYQIPRYKRR